VLLSISAASRPTDRRAARLPWPPSRGDAVGDDEIDRHEDLLVARVSGSHPDSGFDVSTRLAVEVDPAAHCALELRGVAEQARIDGEITVRRVRRQAEVNVCRACLEVNRLCAHHDNGPAVWGEPLKRVQQHPPCRDVPRIHVRGRAARHHGLVSDAAAASEGLCHLGSFLVSHSRSASPSAGIRPFPDRQSIATCVGAA